MKKKLIFIFVTFSFFLVVYNLTIAAECKKIGIVKILSNLKFSKFKECVTKNSIKNNLKSILIKNEIIYDLSRNLKKKLLPNFGNNDFETKDKMSSLVAEFSFTKKNDIIGIVDNKKLLKELSITKDDKIFSKWERSHGNEWNNKFIETSEINTDNAKNLALIWKFNSLKKKKDWKRRIGVNPVYSDGVIYFVSADWKLIAINALTGRLNWEKKFSPNSINNRGILLYDDKNLAKKFIFIGVGEMLYKIDAKSGAEVSSFGENGAVNVNSFQVAPVIYKDIVIIPNTQKSEIVGVEKNTGKIVFKKNIHPKNKFDFYSSPWGGAALDEKNGIYFVVTGNPKPSILGNQRPGDNKNSCSIVAFDINKKKIIWSFQDVIHDLWDYDISAPPIIADLEIDEFLLEVIIVTTKTGNIYLFERKTGKSLYDISYKDTIKSNIPGEFVSKRQPFVEQPERFSKIEFSKNDLRVEILNNERFMERFNEEYEYGWFIPPKLGKTVVFYGLTGGNNWYGSAYDPIKQHLYIPSNHIPYKIRVFPKSSNKNLSFIKQHKFFKFYQKNCSSCHGANRNGKYELSVDIEKSFIPSLVGFNNFDSLKNKFSNYEKVLKLHNDIKISKLEYQGLKSLFFEWDKYLSDTGQIYLESYWSRFYGPDGIYASKPPWGTLTSIKLGKNIVNWKKPFGIRNKDIVGLHNNGGISLTSTGLIAANGTTDNYAYIYNANNGEILWKFKMQAAGTAPPLVFNHENKTYISFLSTGGIYEESEIDSTIYTFGIKND